jgi:hypothetical protein
VNASVLRICAPFTAVPRGQCVIPRRCLTEQCKVCGQDVHYDPAAAIPALGAELIVCMDCTEKAWEAVDAEWKDGSR